MVSSSMVVTKALAKLFRTRLTQQIGSWMKFHYPRPVFFNLFGVAEPQGCSPVTRGTPVPISAKERQNILSFVAFV